MRIGALVVLLALAFAPLARAEDGYDLWLRYRPIEAQNLARYRAAATQIVLPATPSPTIVIARDELRRGLSGLLAQDVAVSASATRDGSVILGTPTSSPAIAAQRLDLSALGQEGYLIKSASVDRHAATIITANSDVGVLYGTFAYLRLIQTRQPLANLNLTSAPRIALRVLDHWDNLDGTIERGYAGHSIWDWHKLPDYLDPRYADYARADASIGINAICLTNVAANATSLTPEWLHKAAAIAAVMRPYGIRIFLTARFSAPIEIGGLPTADPLDPRVRAWWRAKADEIYSIIPDFGGFLVKANSEGQPGPQDYHRTHADGANMLAEALEPHHGVVMWRAFVYSAENPIDRAMQAYNDFAPLDGKFLPNVIVQVKNGPIDFQPREPIHPIFGAMPHTAVAIELQITKEYLGQATNLAYLAPMWREALDTDTYAAGDGSTVARVVDGTLFHNSVTAIAGVSNVGDNRNWTGGVMEQANWYAYGRLAWDHELTSEAIAEEWTRMTFGNDPHVVPTVVSMLMRSREAVVDYMTPLGLAHQMATGHHYGPGPWVHDLSRPEWNPTYYNRADASGIGFDRTHTGSNAVSQYSQRLGAEYDAIGTTPEKFLLWFHHVPWDYRLASGHTIWDELVAHYSHGVDEVHHLRTAWQTLQPYVDAERYAQIDTFLHMQENDAQWWRDASIAYFQSLSHQPLPAGFAAPAHDLVYYEAIHTLYVPGDPSHTAAPFKDQ
ncbi:MAG: alpha-glucuronidase family glycosyl hydrolase [Alphaproteobacteria bacterium]